MSVTFAPPETRPGSRLWRGPWISIASVIGFLLIWFVAAEWAQSRMLPGPVAVIEFIYEETIYGDLMTQLGITLFVLSRHNATI